MPNAYNPLADLRAEERALVLRALKHPTQRSLDARFPFWAHDGQGVPPGDWRTWVIMAGRGFGKTRAGAEWVLGMGRGEGLCSPPGLPGGAGGGCERSEHSFWPHGEPHPRPLPEVREGSKVRIALIAATVEEARAVMVEGPSGILACARADDIRDWSPARRTLTFASGAQAFLYSGASPESLRGPEHDFAWCDELAKWRHPKATWDNLQLGLRRGVRPRAVVTTTPKAGTVLDAILAAKGTVRTGGGTRANPYLPEAYVEAVEGLYAGTRYGAQELDGVLLRDVEGSLWPAGLIAGARAAAPSPRLRGEGWGEGPCADDGTTLPVEGGLPLSPTLSPEGEREMFARIVIGVDPPASVSGTCGIVVCGLAQDGRGYVLEDASVAGRSPEGWARAVVEAAERWGADRVIVERNQGGDMVTSVLRAAKATLPIRAVHASRGKSARAEPVAALFESGRAVFAGTFPALEAELSGLQTGGGYAPGYWSGPGGPGQGPGASPDRADAMVWALTALMLETPPPEPRIRVI